MCTVLVIFKFSVNKKSMSSFLTFQCLHYIAKALIHVIAYIYLYIYSILCFKSYNFLLFPISTPTLQDPILGTITNRPKRYKILNYTRVSKAFQFFTLAYKLYTCQLQGLFT